MVASGILVERLALRAVAPRATVQRLCWQMGVVGRSFRPLLRGRSSRSARTATYLGRVSQNHVAANSAAAMTNVIGNAK